ncbi:NUDIX hydrolase [Xylanimonas cellulosilytica DSM 15894]|uniref:NAD(+) diphosphatase n=1 Tax=Xylanimonas cellulosilytica (strain DSM 15894 / JCM 12276 / CECT 5975 / KCTC 9989 / LMG 20990 / NBRC 107835 / XIL07) TaxID=446471 RepID=D1BXL2_XYLCX|nr:NAD(+) diphosphatase [Xylanimonas cellulosilytica]ACZ29822.1 NUDIX hydrolase [Xylanimonas cellulosilytica DSM 15894]
MNFLPRVAALDLPLARALHDRAAEHRDDPGLLARLYAEPATRVLLLHGDRLAVVGAEHDAHLAWAAPTTLPGPVDPGPTPPPRPDAADDPADVVRDTPPAQEPPLWLYLGEHDGAAYLALAVPPTDEALAALDGAELRAVRGVRAGSDRLDQRGGFDRLNHRGREAAGQRGGFDKLNHREAGGGWRTLRSLDALDDLEQGLATQAVSLTNWHAVHAFCPRCGAPTHVRKAGWVRWCPVEDRELYPRTDPAVIMAVVDDDDRLLLGHAAHWPARRFSTLAGFVEPGESLEQAVRREVAEEVGVVVADGPADVVYRGSQAWPFPASLMLGFRARVVGRGAVAAPDGVELSDARWFTRAELLAAVEGDEVRLPVRLSIARALIEEWYGEPLPGGW